MESFAVYRLCQCHVSTAAFSGGTIRFYDFYADIVMEKEDRTETSALFIPYQELLYFKVVRTRNMVHIAAPDEFIVPWAKTNKVQDQLSDLSDATALENCKYPIALELSDSSSLQDLLQSVAPQIARDRQSRSFSRISVSVFLPLGARVDHLSSDVDDAQPPVSSLVSSQHSDCSHVTTGLEQTQTPPLNPAAAKDTRHIEACSQHEQSGSPHLPETLSARLEALDAAPEVLLRRRGTVQHAENTSSLSIGRSSQSAANEINTSRTRKIICPSLVSSTMNCRRAGGQQRQGEQIDKNDGRNIFTPSLSPQRKTPPQCTTPPRQPLTSTASHNRSTPHTSNGRSPRDTTSREKRGAAMFNFNDFISPHPTATTARQTPNMTTDPSAPDPNPAPAPKSAQWEQHAAYLNGLLDSITSKKQTKRGKAKAMPKQTKQQPSKKSANPRVKPKKDCKKTSVVASEETRQLQRDKKVKATSDPPAPRSRTPSSNGTPAENVNNVPQEDDNKELWNQREGAAAEAGGESPPRDGAGMLGVASKSRTPPLLKSTLHNLFVPTGAKKSDRVKTKHLRRAILALNQISYGIQLAREGEVEVRGIFLSLLSDPLDSHPS